MEKPDLEKTMARWERLASNGDDKALQLTAVYQDPLTRDWATELWQRVTEMIGKEVVKYNSWKLSDLTHPQILPDAAREAAGADMLIVSVRATEQLDPALYVWSEAWIADRKPGAGALVALIGVPESELDPSSAVRDFLRSVARRTGMDFLPRERKLKPAGDLSYIEFLNDRATRMTPLIGEILNRPRDTYRHWGINE